MKFKLFIFCLPLVLFFSTGCNVFGGAFGSKESKPPITTRKDPVQKPKDSVVVLKEQPEVDTIIKDKPNNTEKPLPLAKKDHIKVAVVIPASGGYNINRFSEFVNGIQLSAEAYYSGKPQIQIQIADIGNTNEESTLSNNSVIKSADILVGGFQTSQVKSLAAIAARNKIPYLSVWNTSADIVTDNPYYIQLKPSLETLCMELAKYIATSLRPQTVFILFKSTSTKDYTTKDFYKAALEKHHIPYQFVVTNKNDEWKNLLQNSENAAIIIPNWDDKNYISKTLSTISSLKKSHFWTIAGMPQWVDFDEMNFGLYESLSLVIPVLNYVNESEINAGIFRSKYIQRYNTFPGSESYYGYDVAEIVVKIALSRAAGHAFDPVSQINGKYNSIYNIQSNFAPAPGTETGVRSTYSHNTYITIQKFEGGRFVPIR